MKSSASRTTLLAYVICMLGSAVATVTVAQDSEVTVTTKSHGDWQVRCEQVKGADKICVMQQQAIVQGSGQKLMQVNIAKQGGSTKMTMIMPLGVYLPSGAVMRDGGEEIKDMVIRFCAQTGCFINHDIDSIWLKSLKKADKPTVDIEITPGEVVNVPFSTIGFAAAYDSL